MTSTLFIRHKASGAIVAELSRDGRGAGVYPLEYYNKTGSYLSQEQNYQLKPEYTSTSIVTNTDNYSILTNNKYVVSQDKVNEYITVPISNFRNELANGQEILRKFSDRENTVEPDDDTINTEITLEEDAGIKNITNNSKYLIPAAIGGVILVLLLSKKKR